MDGNDMFIQLAASTEPIVITDGIAFQVRVLRHPNVPSTVPNVP
jgi:hypothetical protein